MPKKKDDLELTIGNLVLALPFDKEIKARIAKQLTSESRTREIFLASAEHTAEFKNSKVGKIKVKGFSPGRKEHTKAVLEKVIKSLTDGADTQKKIGWNIYIETITNYITGKQKNLNKLLAGLPAGNEKLTSPELLEIICKNAKQYEVLPEIIRELYEIWSFDRIGNLDEMLSLCAKDDPVAVAMKRIKALDNHIASLNKNSEAHDEQGEANAIKINGLQEEVASLNKFPEEIKETLACFDSKTKSLYNTLEEKQNEKNELVKFKLEELTASLKELESSIKKLFEGFSSQNNEIRKLVSTELKEAKDSIIDSNKLKIKKELDHINLKIEGKMKQLEETLPSALVQSESEYQSPLIGKIQANKVQSYKIKDEWRFINIWKNHLEKELDVLWPIELVVITHTLFKSSKAIIMDDDRIFYCWQRTLGWENFNLQTVASPTWMSEADWGNEANYLFGDQINTTTPKFVTIHQYNVALVSCYLIPTLKLWHISPHSFDVSKLFLIEAISENQKSNPDLLELATYFNESELDQDRKYPQLSKHKELALGKEKSHTGVSLDTYKSWVLVQRKDDGFSSDIDTVAGTIDVRIPLALKLNYARMRNALEQYFSEDDAKIVSAHHLLYPWLEEKHGEGSAEKLACAIKGLFSKPLDY